MSDIFAATNDQYVEKL